MSTFYMPDGARIVIHVGWKQTIMENGVIKLHDHDGNFLGTILASGAIHLSANCAHTYYPPSIKSINEAVRIVQENLSQVHVYDLDALKQRLKKYNIKTKTLNT